MENPLTGIDEIQKIGDPAERAREIGRRLKQIPDFQAALREMRQTAVLEMKASGMTYAAIAAEIGLHRNRIQQIAEGRSTGGGHPSVKRPPAPVEEPPSVPAKKATRARKTS